MACVCGAFICYICRADITKEKYAHFCQTPHCTHETCGRCVLFTDSIADDRKAMYEAGVNTTKAVEAKEGADVNVALDKLLEGGMPVAKKARNGEDEYEWRQAVPPPPGMAGGGGGMPPGLAAFGAAFGGFGMPGGGGFAPQPAIFRPAPMDHALAAAMAEAARRREDQRQRRAVQAAARRALRRAQR